MKVAKRVEHKIRMGEYETLTVSVFVEEEIPDGVTKEHALDEIDEVIDSALEADIQEARKLSDPASYIKVWRK